MRYQNHNDLRLILDRLPDFEIVMLDGGARNGSIELSRLAPYSANYGFEPNLDEFKKIPANGSHFKRCTYSPLALLAKSGDGTLYITRRPAATSTLKPNKDFIRHFARDNWSQMADVVGEERVQGVGLADFFNQNKMSHVDYMKLDTQGNELDILKSSGDFLKNISVIKTEVEMAPLYQNQPLFGDVFTFLTNAGFQFVDLQSSNPCRRFHFSPSLPLESYRLIWGDAVFARAPFDFSGPRKREQALVLAEMGYLDLALYIIENAPAFSGAERAALLEFYQRPKEPVGNSSLARWFKKVLPGRVVNAIAAARRSSETKQVKAMP